MTDPAVVSVAEDALRSALSSGERPKRPNALSTSLTFGWRALLKIKHIPEQLFDQRRQALLTAPGHANG